MIRPQRFEPGEAFAWSSKERCEEIVAHWVSQRASGEIRRQLDAAGFAETPVSSPTYTIRPATEDAEMKALNPPAWAHVIEVAS